MHKIPWQANKIFKSIWESPWRSRFRSKIWMLWKIFVFPLSGYDPLLCQMSKVLSFKNIGLSWLQNESFIGVWKIYSPSNYLSIYIYIHIYMCVCVYIYIYIYIILIWYLRFPVEWLFWAIVTSVFFLTINQKEINTFKTSDIFTAEWSYVYFLHHHFLDCFSPGQRCWH